MDNAIKLLNALVRNGWSANVMHETDTGENPFVAIQAIKGSDHVWASWHTRNNTGKHRLYNLLVNEAESTLTKALEFIKTGGEQGD